MPCDCYWLIVVWGASRDGKIAQYVQTQTTVCIIPVCKRNIPVYFHSRNIICHTNQSLCLKCLWLCFIIIYTNELYFMSLTYSRVMFPIPALSARFPAQRRLLTAARGRICPLQGLPKPSWSLLCWASYRNPRQTGPWGSKARSQQVWTSTTFHQTLRLSKSQ